MKKSLIIIIIIVLIILILGGLLFYFINKNTAFLKIAGDPDPIWGNNLSEEINPVTLEGPEEFIMEEIGSKRKFNLPKGFNIEIFVTGLEAPRFFTWDDQGNMYVADRNARKIYMISPDGEKIEFDADLLTPHSVYFYNGDLYSGEEDKIVVYKKLDGKGSYENKEVVVSNLPAGGNHVTRTVVVGPDEKLYVSIGSSCNVCEEEDARRAAVVQYDLDGSNEKIFATGLRNSVGLVWQNGQLWSTDNGRDLIGDDLPPEEVNIIKEGEFYGWPYCYGDGIANPEYEDQDNFCKNDTAYPAYNMQAHSAPLGIAFLPEENNWPEIYQNNAFIAFHGSWNRSIPTGYKIVRINTDDPEASAENFISGWLDTNYNAWGRPAGIGFGPDGAMYISDDKLGVIYKINFNNEKQKE